MFRPASMIAGVALFLAACSTAPEPEPEVVRQEAAPRPSLTALMLEGEAVRTLADEASADEILRQTARSAAAGYEGDNKGNACFTEPVLEGVAGGALNPTGTRREEFWTYSVCGETYEVPVIVTKQQGPGTVAFTVGSGREAR